MTAQRHKRIVMLVSAAALAATVAFTASAARAQCDDPDKQLFGMNIDPYNPVGNPSPAELQAAGVRWARIEWKVGAVEVSLRPTTRKGTTGFPNRHVGAATNHISSVAWPLGKP